MRECQDPRPDARVSAYEAGQLLKASLEHLPERERQIVLLRNSGKTSREIAELFDCCHLTILNIENRALKRMRMYLAREHKVTALRHLI